MSTIYLIIAIALLARGALFAYLWITKRRRIDDLRMAIAFVLISISFGLYGFQHQYEGVISWQYAIDALLCLYMVYTFISSIIKEINRKG